MIVKERLLWILDRPESETAEMRAKNLPWMEYMRWFGEYQNKEIAARKEFVHSLGLKCDSVGWCNLDMTRPDAGDILEKIAAFCEEGGWLARGCCSRWYEEFESDWYELAVPQVKGLAKYAETTDENGAKVKIKELCCYKERGNHVLDGIHGDFFVSERFREACIRHQVPGLRFCWVRDVGRYAAEQFFSLHPDRWVTRIASNQYLRYSDSTITGDHTPHKKGSELYRRLEQVGGYFPRVAELFYVLDCFLPDHYLKSELPEEGFVRSCYHKGGHFGRDCLLIHRKTAEMLLEEKLISKKLLRPVPFYEEDAVPPGYVVTEMGQIPIPRQSYMDEMQAEYEKFILKPRPERKATEKEALKLLRKAKIARKENFGKKLKKELCEQLDGTVYAPLEPYYLVANGGSISDEYEVMPVEKLCEEAAEFAKELDAEEQLEQPVEGVPFVWCADGDRVILRPDGSVARFSHEEPEMTEMWPTLAQFFADCIEIEE